MYFYKNKLNTVSQSGTDVYIGKTKIVNAQSVNLDSVILPPYLDGGAYYFVFNNELHILGGTITENMKKHYKWNGSSWVQVSVLPCDFSYVPTTGIPNDCRAVFVMDNALHILKWNTNDRHYYCFKNNEWISQSASITFGSTFTSGRFLYTKETDERLTEYSYYENSNKTSNQIYSLYYDKADKVWKNGDIISNNAGFKCVTEYDGNLVLIGNSKYQIVGVGQYDKPTGQIQSAIVHNNKIYVLQLDSVTNSEFTSLVPTYYSFDGTTWTKEGTYMTLHNNGYLLEYDNKLYIAGGCDTIYANRGVYFVEELGASIVEER